MIAVTAPGCKIPAMGTLAEVERAAEALSAAEQRALFQFLAARMQDEPVSKSVRTYRIKTHPGRVLPGIDPDKIGQLPEDF